MKPTHLLPVLLPLASAWGSSANSNPKKILLSDVASLTLRADKQTSHRRVPSIPQLKCISPSSICRLYTIDVMRCTNAGAGYGDEDIQWTCTATLPEELKLGRTDVICEGYSGPDDPYVLKGSCGVEYTMYLTDKGRERHPGVDDGWLASEGWTWGGIVFALFVIGILGWTVYSNCVANQQNRQPRPDRPRRFGNGGGFWGGGGGGGPGGWGPGWGPGGGNNEPPPPYPGTSQPKPPEAGGQQQQWRPGFFSGLAGGAAAGYLAGQRAGNQQQRPPWGADRDRYEWDHNHGHRNYGSTWGPHGHRSGSRSSEGSSTGAAHESTGFGSTSRR